MMRTGLTGLAAAAAVALTAAGLGSAQAADDVAGDAFAGLEPLDDDTLREMRGGFSAGGMEIQFAVSIIDSVLGSVILSSDPNGPVTDLARSHLPDGVETGLAGDLPWTDRIIVNTMNDTVISLDRQITILFENYAQDIAVGGVMTQDINLIGVSRLTGF